MRNQHTMIERISKNMFFIVWFIGICYHKDYYFANFSSKQSDKNVFFTWLYIFGLSFIRNAVSRLLSSAFSVRFILQRITSLPSIKKTFRCGYGFLIFINGNGELVPVWAILSWLSDNSSGPEEQSFTSIPDPAFLSNKFKISGSVIVWLYKNRECSDQVIASWIQDRIFIGLIHRRESLPSGKIGFSWWKSDIRGKQLFLFSNQPSNWSN